MWCKSTLDVLTFCTDRTPPTMTTTDGPLTNHHPSHHSSNDDHMNILLERAVIDQPVELTIQTVSGNCHSVIAFSSWSVHSVKEAVSGLTNHSVNQQRLLFGTRVLSDTEILVEFLPSDLFGDTRVVRDTHHEMLLIISIDDEQANIVTSLVLGRVGLENVDRKYQEDLYVVEAAVRRNGLNLEHAHGAARKDKTNVFAAVVQNGFALSFAPQEFSSEPDVVLAAVRSSAFAITLANHSLQTSCDFAIKAVHANSFVIDYLERCVLDNVEFQRAFSNADKLAPLVNHAVRKSSLAGKRLVQMEQDIAAAQTPLCQETKKTAASKKCNPLRWLRSCISTQRQHTAVRSNISTQEQRMCEAARQRMCTANRISSGCANRRAFDRRAANVHPEQPVS